MKKLLQVKNLNIAYNVKSLSLFKTQKTYAVNNLSFDVYQGEILGIVGESGSGKSSLARSIVGLNNNYLGDIIFNDNVYLKNLNKRQWKNIHKQIQYVFQDPISSLNQRMTLTEIITEPLKINFPDLTSKQMNDKLINISNLVGINPAMLSNYPSECSGGQCQRVGLARSLILEPQLLICDESVSSLDVSIKAQIINLLTSLQEKLKLTIIFISHDLSIVKQISNRVMVMYLGRLMEISPSDQIFDNANHPYTKALISSMPIPDPILQRKNRVMTLHINEKVNSSSLIKGCVYSSQCQLADELCKKNNPPLITKNNSIYACLKV